MGNPMQQAMLAVDPSEEQQAMLAAYKPAQLTAPQQGGQYGMSVGQMQNAVMQRKMADADKVDQIQQDGMGVA